MSFISHLRSELASVADTDKARQMKAYMRDQYAFYGVMAKLRRECFTGTLKHLGLPEDALDVSKQLFRESQRELHHCGQELLLKAKKQWNNNSMQDFEWFITTNSWWDTVDFLAINVVGQYCRRFPEEYWRHKIEEWANSDHLWLQRTAIIYQIKYRKDTDLDWLEKVIRMHAHQKEFFIRKAIGWALREYSKTDPEWVEALVARIDLQPLSKKEALRLI